MATISVTAASVLAGSSALVEYGNKAGATLTAGQVVYKDTADGTLKLADADGAAALKTAYGITLNGAGAGQPVAVAKRGPVTFNAVLTAGTTYCASATPGGIAPQADITTGGEVIVLGTALSTTVLDVQIKDTNVTL